MTKCHHLVNICIGKCPISTTCFTSLIGNTFWPSVLALYVIQEVIPMCNSHDVFSVEGGEGKRDLLTKDFPFLSLSSWLCYLRISSCLHKVSDLFYCKNHMTSVPVRSPSSCSSSVLLLRFLVLEGISLFYEPWSGWVLSAWVIRTQFNWFPFMRLPRKWKLFCTEIAPQKGYFIRSVFCSEFVIVIFRLFEDPPNIFAPSLWVSGEHLFECKK